MINVFFLFQSNPEFGWDRTIQGLVLSAFFVGFAIALIVGGFVADLYRAKLVLVVGNLVQGILSLLLPEATRLLGAPALGVLRVLQGLASVSGKTSTSPTSLHLISVTVRSISKVKLPTFCVQPFKQSEAENSPT